MTDQDMSPVTEMKINNIPQIEYLHTDKALMNDNDWEKFNRFDPDTREAIIARCRAEMEEEDALIEQKRLNDEKQLSKKGKFTKYSNDGQNRSSSEKQRLQMKLLKKQGLIE
jgi:hypothetical protein